MNNALPKAMRLNNPCGMVHNAGPNKPESWYGAMPVYKSVHEGLIAAASWIDSVYTVQGHTTLAAFIPRLYTGRGVELVGLLNQWRDLLGQGAGEMHNRPLNLHQAWRTIDFMRHWIRRENGPCPATWSDGCEWVHPDLLVGAVCSTRRWAVC